MICLKCGYCCIKYEVIIVNNPELGIKEDNLITKSAGDRCKHLIGDKIGEYQCSIHFYKWYKETPCFAFGQVEEDKSDLCRIGIYTLKKEAKCVSNHVSQRRNWK